MRLIQDHYSNQWPSIPVHFHLIPILTIVILVYFISLHLNYLYYYTFDHDTITDHHGKTTTGPAVNVRPPTDAKRRHGTDYCAIAQIAVNRDNVISYTGRMFNVYLSCTLEYLVQYNFRLYLQYAAYSISSVVPNLKCENRNPTGWHHTSLFPIYL